MIMSGRQTGITAGEKRKREEDVDEEGLQIEELEIKEQEEDDESAKRKKIEEISGTIMEF